MSFISILAKAWTVHVCLAIFLTYAGYLAFGSDVSIAGNRLGEGAWIAGLLNSDNLPSTDLRPLKLEHEGGNIWKSNNPEIFRGDGWLMQNGEQAPSRGGVSQPLQACSIAYLFHINKSGERKYLHLISRPREFGSLSVSVKGSLYSNAEKPLLPGRISGPSYFVALDWLQESFRTTQTITKAETNEFIEIARTELSAGAMADGRFEVCGTSDYYLYSVISTNGTLQEAGQLAEAQQALGDIYKPGTNAFGREAGIYTFPTIKGISTLNLPAYDAFTGFHFNTTNKFDKSLQDQTQGSVMNLGDSSSQTHGNYGHKFEVTIGIHNPQATTRIVRLWMASRLAGPLDSPSFTWNGPVRVNDVLQEVYLTPRKAKQKIGQLQIEPKLSEEFKVVLYVPGLITANQQLIIESLSLN